MQASLVKKREKKKRDKETTIKEMGARHTLTLAAMYDPGRSCGGTRRYQSLHNLHQGTFSCQSALRRSDRQVCCLVNAMIPVYQNKRRGEGGEYKSNRKTNITLDI